MTTEELMNLPLDLEKMRKVYDNICKEAEKRGKTKYGFWVRKKDGQVLECRQCRYSYLWQAMREAELYRAWAEHHYGCECVYDLFAEDSQ